MKQTAVLINTSRGPVVDEQALADALNADKISGAAVDVLGAEPATRDNPLLSAKLHYNAAYCLGGKGNKSKAYFYT